MFKIKNLAKVLCRKKQALTILKSFPPVDEFAALVGDHIVCVIVDLDGTVAPFDQYVSHEMLQLLQEYPAQGVNLVLYSNTSDHERLSWLKNKGLQVYEGSVPKPYSEGYLELGQEFGVELSHAVMIGDSPMTDIPDDENLLGGVILIQPILPLLGFRGRLHYTLNLFLQKFVTYTKK